MKRLLLALVTVTALLLTSCGGLSAMKKKANTVRYQATPNPMETMDGKVQIKFSGAIPAKYFDKNVAVFIQPVLNWEGGRIPLTPMQLKGENVGGEGTTISYDNGGRFTYYDNIWNLNRMQKSPEEPGVEPGSHCSLPYQCWYYGYCHKNKIF